MATHPPPLEARPSARRQALFLLAVLLGTAAAFVYFARTQPVASYALEPRLDGNDYLRMHAYFKGVRPDYTVRFPFHGRVVVPWLAAQVPVMDPIRAFQVVNLVFALLAVAATGLCWRRLGIGMGWQAAGFGWLLLHWPGLLRLNAFDPATVDVPLYVVHPLLLLIVLTRRWGHLLWLAPLATLQKESFPALLLGLLAWNLWQAPRMGRRAEGIAWLAVALGLAWMAQYAVAAWFPSTNTGHSLQTVALSVWQTLRGPFRLVRWAAGVWMAFGGLAVLACLQWVAEDGLGRLRRQWYQTETAATDADTQILAVLAAVSLALSLVAGGDFTRLAFLGFPFLFTLVLRGLAGTPPWLAALAGLLSVPLMRLGGTIPDPGGQWAAFAGWYPELAPVPVTLGWLAYGAAVTAALWWAVRQTAAKQT